MEFDVIIIGSGISGACAAREISRYRLRALVVEKGYDLCAGATRGNSATVHSGHDAEYGSLKALYNVRGNAMYDALCADLDVPFTRSGTVIFATNEAEMAEVRRLKENADRNGVPGCEVLTRDALNALEDGWGGDVVGALYAPTGGVVCPYTLAFALCENAAENGVAFRTDTEVRGIRRTDGGYRLTTSRGELTAACVFNCAGTHADEMNNFVSGHTLRIIPRKGEHILLDCKLAPYVQRVWSQTPSALPGGGHTKGMGVIPSVDRTVILGCDAHEVHDKDDTSTTAAGTGEILRYFERNWRHLPISRAIPEFPRSMVIGAFGGLRPHSDTDDFVLGQPADAPGFYNMAGIESPGLTAAPAIAEALVAQAAQSRGWVKNPGFNPLRRRPKPFREMTADERREAIARDPDYGRFVCRCEQVTLAEIKQAIRSPLGARTVNGVKMRTRAGMGRCQGGFCGPDVVRILSEELGIPMTEVTRCGGDSRILAGETCVEEEP